MLNASSSVDSSNSNSLSQFVQTAFSYNGNIMLVAIISLLFVILFVLLLHLYAKWFLSQARRRSRNPISISHLLPSQFLPFTYDDGADVSFPDCGTKGLDASVVASLPVFVHKSSFVDTEQPGEGLLECVICLSVFEDDDIGKILPRCGHAFHVECVDMWLHSHSSCPICRAPVDLVSQKKKKVHKEDEAAANRIENADVISTQVNRGELLLETNMTGESRTQTTVIEIRERSAEQNECVSASAASSSSQSALMLGYSLKRMLSRNRSEHKVFPSTVNNLSLHP